MNEGKFIAFLSCNNGVVVTFFKFFRLAFIKDTNDEGKFLSISIIFGKLDFTFTVAWKNQREIVFNEDLIGYS